jgi:CDP-glycerol glycerophosphotransferase (TagB/SpsB family)
MHRLNIIEELKIINQKEEKILLFKRVLQKVFQKSLEKILFFLIKIINIFFPKDPKYFLFYSYPDFADNARCMWEYVINVPNLKTVWIVENSKMYDLMKKSDINVYLKNSLGGAIQMMRAKHYVVTHSQLRNIKSKNQVMINVWHGMPLKGMGSLNKSDTPKGVKTLSESVDYLISTSKIMKHIMASCFNIDSYKVIVTGQPRNDKLFNSDGKSCLSKILGINIDNYSKIILYTPTFRHGVPTFKQDIRNWIEGNVLKENFFHMNDYDEQKFFDFLQKNNYLFVVKLHPFEENLVDENTTLSDNCVLIKSSDFNIEIDLYNTLNAFDLLITDYSSIYFDYLLLDRPIVFTRTDFEKYEDTRGFVFDDIEFWTPGEKATNFESLIKAIESSLYNDINKINRETINKLINFYQDDKACERILSITTEILKDT